MAEIRLVIPNNQIDRAVDALCAAGGYTGPAGDTIARRDFAHSVVRDFVQQTVLRHERQQAMTEAMSNVVVHPVPID